MKIHINRMEEVEVHLAATYLQLALAPVTFLLLSFVSAPYGRHGRPGYGVQVPFLYGWVLMESPALILFSAIYFGGSQWMNPIPLGLYALWTTHYTNRTLVLPLRQSAVLRSKNKSKPMPLTVVLLGFAFNSLNAYINSRWIGHFASYPPSVPPHFVTGVLLFLFGLFVNIRSDLILLNIRRKSEGYKIPHGFLFDYVTAPNYLGEIIEWVGWAITSNSLAGVAFALYTAANLLPRAAAHHRWYQRTFKLYPKNRRRLFPFVW